MDRCGRLDFGNLQLGGRQRRRVRPANDGVSGCIVPAANVYSHSHIHLALAPLLEKKLLSPNSFYS
jgi:hypothetical protein